MMTCRGREHFIQTFSGRLWGRCLCLRSYMDVLIVAWLLIQSPTVQSAAPKALTVLQPYLAEQYRKGQIDHFGNRVSYGS